MKYLFCFILMLITCRIDAQQYNYVQYDTKDGLAGSIVYDMVQDQDGFLWFATENGLSRFDGSAFKNYTVKDGLPDNEVLKVFADNSGRLWVACFSNRVCYYYKGKIYNGDNDSLVKQIKLPAMLTCMAEAKDGTLAFFYDGSKILLVQKNARVVEYSFPKALVDNPYFTVAKSNRFIAVGLDSLRMIYNEATGTFQKSDFSKNEHKIGMRGTAVVYRTDTFSVIKLLRFKEGFINFSPAKDNGAFFNTSDGAWYTDSVATTDWLYKFLPGKKVTASFIDKEKNYWFATMGSGVYKLPSKDIQLYVPGNNNPFDDPQVMCISKIGNTVFAGLSGARLMKLDSAKNISINDYRTASSLSPHISAGANRLYCLLKQHDGSLLLGFDASLAKLEKDRLVVKPLYPIKALTMLDEANVFVGTKYYVFKVRSSDLSVVDTVWRDRCTQLHYANGKLYVGTLNGLYQVDVSTYAVTFLGSLHPALSRRISGILSDDAGRLWVATSDAGIIALKDEKVITVIADSAGLTSNNCRAVSILGNIMWVGTNKGLNKIDIGNKNFPVTHFSTSDGLPGDVINAVYADDSIVWLGTPQGLVSFPEKSVSKTSVCDLNLLGITINNKPFDTIPGAFSLQYKDRISLSFAAVSIRSSGDIIYYYRLNGLDTGWRSTNSTSVDYQAIPPGNYQWELYAINKFGIKSKTITVSFTVDAPFWQTGWFYVLVFLGAVSLVGWIFNLRSKRMQYNLNEKNKINQQFAELEQQALQAQMNPHFIFNCLNSIQQYIITNEKEKANIYLTGFASLVRTTLELSGKKNITVQEEAAYLAKYIEMEQLRFGGSFSYSISIDDAVHSSYILMPALLLQPLVENSLRHGIRNKPGSRGEVNVIFTIKNNCLFCIVKDNGVGRKQAQQFKKSTHIEYQSRGIELTQKRIDLLNKTSNKPVKMEINDLFDEAGNAAGTEVIIKIAL